MRLCGMLWPTPGSQILLSVGTRVQAEPVFQIWRPLPCSPNAFEDATHICVAAAIQKRHGTCPGSVMGFTELGCRTGTAGPRGHQHRGRAQGQHLLPPLGSPGSLPERAASHIIQAPVHSPFMYPPPSCQLCSALNCHRELHSLAG